MKRKILAFAFAGLVITALITGCSQNDEVTEADSNLQQNNQTVRSENNTDGESAITLSSEIIELEKGFSAVRFEGDDGFEDFLSAGGATSDAAVVKFLSSNLLADFDIVSSLFGCSTLTTRNIAGEVLFGRNFDWQNCEAMVVFSKPTTGYASISTVNMDFISQSGGAIGAVLKLNDVRTLAALYAPLDGMNEAGFTVAVNMIEDFATIEQNTDKPDITTTTVIRLLLNKAANVDEALELLRQYDMHGSMGMMVHFAMADRAGKSVVVEYVDNQMIVTETPVVTNFYLAEGEKNGMGSSQSHERYDILMQMSENYETMDMENVRDAMDSVSKDNFEEFASTEWSIVFNLNTKTAHYYHREGYENRYIFQLE